jgi:hypothetical protein
MTTSGSIDFGLVTNTIIDEACQIAGIASEGEAVSAYTYEAGRRSLNMIVKAWSASEHLWLRTVRTVALIASTSSYALTPKPGRVLEVRRRLTSGTIDTPLTEWSREEYLAQPNKTSEGTPVAFYYDPQLTTGTLYLWPVPSTAVVAAFPSLQMTYLRRIEDFDSSNNDPDLPPEWTLALTYALAEQLALKFGRPGDIRSEIAARAADYKAMIESWDTEPASLYLQPSQMWG